MHSFAQPVLPPLKRAPPAYCSSRAYALGATPRREPPPYHIGARQPSPRVQRGRVGRGRAAEVKARAADAKRERDAAGRQAREAGRSSLQVLNPLANKEAAAVMPRANPLAMYQDAARLTGQAKLPAVVQAALAKPKIEAVGAEDALQIYQREGRLGTRRRKPPRELPALALDGLAPTATLYAIQMEHARVQNDPLERYALGGAAADAKLPPLLASRPYKGAAVKNAHTNALLSLLGTMTSPTKKGGA